MSRSTITLQEKSSYRYVYIDPDTNALHVMMPINGGNTVATDNTCKTAKALDDFWNDPGLSATSQLTTYRHDLQADIATLQSYGSLFKAEIKQKQERLQQVQMHLQALDAVRSDHQAGLSALGGGSGDLPESVKMLVASDPGISSMVLRPGLIDRDQVRSLNKVCTFNRQDSNPANPHGLPLPDSAFVTALTAGMVTLNRPTPQSNYEQAAIAIIESFKERFYSSTDEEKQAAFTEMIYQLQSKFNTHFRQGAEPVSLQTIKVGMPGAGAAFTLDNLNDSYEFLDDEDDYDAEEIYNMVNYMLIPDDGWPDASPFDMHLAKLMNPLEKVSILTQFFIGTLNIACHSKDISNANFGQVFENNNELTQAFIENFRQALNQGQSPEHAIIRFVNSNTQQFGMSRQITEQEAADIATQFKRDFLSVANAPHFDEFTLFNQDPHSAFKCHQGEIRTGFAAYATQLGHTAHYKPPYNSLAHSSRDLPPDLSGANEASREVEYTLEKVEQAVRNDITHMTQIPDLARLLCHQTSDRAHVFELLNADTKQLLQDSDNLRMLKAEMVKYINDANRATFQAEFGEFKREMFVSPQQLQGLIAELIITKKHSNVGKGEYDCEKDVYDYEPEVIMALAKAIHDTNQDLNIYKRDPRMYWATKVLQKGLSRVGDMFKYTISEHTNRQDLPQLSDFEKPVSGISCTSDLATVLSTLYITIPADSISITPNGVHFIDLETLDDRVISRLTRTVNSVDLSKMPIGASSYQQIKLLASQLGGEYTAAIARFEDNQTTESFRENILPILGIEQNESSITLSTKNDRLNFEEGDEVVIQELHRYTDSNQPIGVAALQTAVDRQQNESATKIQAVVRGQQTRQTVKQQVASEAAENVKQELNNLMKTVNKEMGRRVLLVPTGKYRAYKHALRTIKQELVNTRQNIGNDHGVDCLSGAIKSIEDTYQIAKQRTRSKQKQGSDNMLDDHPDDTTSARFIKELYRGVHALKDDTETAAILQTPEVQAEQAQRVQRGSRLASNRIDPPSGGAAAAKRQEDDNQVHPRSHH